MHHRPARTLALAVVLGLALATPARADRTRPAMAGVEGQRAFDDLARHYRGEGKPPFAQALKDLRAPDDARRRAAGRYLHALLAQAWADERSGRGPCRPTPFFGGRPVCDARELRGELARAFGREAASEAALEAALWLVDEEKVADNQAAGMDALARISSPRVAEALRRVLARPHPSEAVLARAVAEAGRRKLTALAPELQRLCASPRAAVRKAVLTAAPALGLKLARCAAPTLLPASFEKELAAVAARVLTPPPPAARWVRFEHTNPRAFSGGKPVTLRGSGWLLAEAPGAYRVLDFFARERTLPRGETKLSPRTLAEEARALLAIRAGKGREAREALSELGGLTGQFQPGFISLPEALVAAWALGRGDRAIAASLLLPRIDGTRDDRWIGWAVRDLLGHHYHQEMLIAFSHERDYARATRLARHLSGALFDEYEYQERARELAAQLARRGDDFKALALPTPEAWAKLKATLARPAQISFLTARLRLLNCLQWGQPGGVSYADPQDASSHAARAAGTRPRPVINPYVELTSMKLTPAELPALVPLLADESVLPTFSYWRDFHPQRTLHRVSWLAAELINAAARHDLAALQAYHAADAAGRKRHLERVLAWCRANAGKSPAELRRETIRTSKDWDAVAAAVEEAARAKDRAVLALLLARQVDFPKRREDLARLVYQLGTSQAAPAARRWLKDGEAGVRFWAALTLLRHGRQGALEGLAELRPILAADDGSYRYPQAFDALMDTRQRPAVDLACGILGKARLEVSFGSGGAVLHRLFLAGRPEALAYLLRGLDSQKDGGVSSGSYRGKQVERKQVEGDGFASAIAAWRASRVAPTPPGEYSYEILAPAAERAAERAKLKRWLQEQFKLIRAGKKPAMRTSPDRVGAEQWRLDAPGAG